MAYADLIDMHSACKVLVKEYECMLRKGFSRLIEKSIKKLNKLSEKIKKRFIRDVARRYNMRETNDIAELINEISVKMEWGLDNCQDLFCILKDYVYDDTKELCKTYENFVTGLYEVRAFFYQYNELRIINYAHRLQIRFKVEPAIIEKIKNLWKEICKRFNLPPLNALLYDKRYSSLTLTWLIDADEETSIIIRATLIRYLPANIPFFQANDITHLIYNFEVLYPVS